MLKKVVIIGPESTGKSTLCSQLATHFNSQWCPEYARQYLLENGKEYSFEDLLGIAKGQLELEDTYSRDLKAHRLEKPTPLFIDTDMYVMKVWCEFVFGKCHPFILEQIVERKYDLYLLCNTDLPWVEDELREYPDLESRQRLFHMYKDILVNQSTPWVEIGGRSEERLATAIAAVQEYVLA
ncbi:AAA family ATPase [Flavihumibacter rivuli]|uniref:AAA family ATPase n=1 Tax=Flavihumibacter rivuli TaxID=2838156 RepID=UPI001BDF3942|nr:AAA family ATPase [Flavihumibacter rivuli]ULQ55608.1 AAA family ATPase [Flavihumibacter rivuli]